jgi:propionyl-CoA synthetase
VDYDAVIYGSEEVPAYLLTLHIHTFVYFRNNWKTKGVETTWWLRCCIKIFDAKIYNIKEGDVFWAASDVGWVVATALSFMVLNQ